MPSLDPDERRNDFPALDRTVNGHRLAYLDNAATSQTPGQVIDAVERFYRHTNANAHRGIHTLGHEATECYEEAHTSTAAFLGADSMRSIVLTQHTTEALNMVARGWRDRLGPGKDIVLTPFEHHSSLLPWQRVAEETGAALRFLERDDDHGIDPASIDAVITDSTAVVATTHVSNVTGTVLPVDTLCERAGEVGAVSVVDAAQSVPHMPVDVGSIGCDFLAFSAHKMCGPMGIGVLYGREDRLEAIEPSTVGGGMVDTVARRTASWGRLPWRLEPGTPNIAGAAGLTEAVSYLEEVGRDAVHRHARRLATVAVDRLHEVDGVTVHTAEDSPGIVSFSVDGVPPHDVAQILDNQGVAVRAGDHCCQPLMEELGVDSTVRASCYLYNTEDEIDRLIDGVREAQALFN